MMIKKNVYLISTYLVAIPLIFSGVIYLLNPEIIERANPNMGYPSYFKTELGIAKIIGALALLMPVYEKIKEFAYVGLAIVLISAFITHIAIHDNIKDIVLPAIIFLFLAISYLNWDKLRKSPLKK